MNNLINWLVSTKKGEILLLIAILLIVVLITSIWHGGILTPAFVGILLVGSAKIITNKHKWA